MRTFAVKKIIFVWLLFISIAGSAKAATEFESSFKPQQFNFLQLGFLWNMGLGSPNLTMSGYGIVYDSLDLDLKGLSPQAFAYAVEGFEELKSRGELENDSIITIVDFDQPSTNKRMYILDLKNYKVLFNTWAAHGRNSGTLMATSFGNTMSSYKSSLGFYLTDKTYYGGNGFSLKLKGLEAGLNDRAMARAIVLHGADYVSESKIRELGYLGRSFGCPAVPVNLNRSIIETIKEGTVLFIYNSNYHHLPGSLLS